MRTIAASLALRWICLALFPTLAFGLLLCLSAPSEASTLTTNTSMGPCNNGELCVDAWWYWFGETKVIDLHYTSEVSGEATLALPRPDPQHWSISSGTMTNHEDGVLFSGWFHLADVPIWNIAGRLDPEFAVVGADGSRLAYSLGWPLLAYCDDERPDPLRCGDIYGATNYNYTALYADPAFDGPLTLRYDYRPDWDAVPISATYRLEYSGQIHLVYVPVPEPGTGLLVMAGLLGLAARQRWLGSRAL